MSWVEIIHLRSMENKHQMIRTYMDKLVSDVNSQSENLTLSTFSRHNIKSDHCLHLHHSSSIVRDGGSQLGNHLAEELKQYGIVNHSIWCKNSS